MAVHNHGSEEGPGLSCNEVTLDDGTIKGVCLGNEDMRVLAAVVKNMTLVNCGYVPADVEDGRFKYDGTADLKDAVLRLYYADIEEGWVE